MGFPSSKVGVMKIPPLRRGRRLGKLGLENPHQLAAGCPEREQPGLLGFVPAALRFPGWPRLSGPEMRAAVVVWLSSIRTPVGHTLAMFGGFLLCAGIIVLADYPLPQLSEPLMEPIFVDSFVVVLWLIFGLVPSGIGTLLIIAARNILAAPRPRYPIVASALFGVGASLLVESRYNWA